MRKEYIYAALFALSISCLFGGQFAPPYKMGVQIGEMGRAKFPANVPEWTIGEYEFEDKKGPNKMIQNVDLDGERGLPGYLHPYIH